MPTHDLPGLYMEPRHLSLLRDLLAQHVPYAEVLAYGSRVTGGAHECSDLDLAIRNPQQPQQPSPHIADLIKALQDSLLPILVDTHDWALLPEDFQRNIEKAHVVITSGQAKQSAQSKQSNT